MNDCRKCKFGVRIPLCLLLVYYPAFFGLVIWVDVMGWENSNPLKKAHGRVTETPPDTLSTTAFTGVKLQTTPPHFNNTTLKTGKQGKGLGLQTVSNLERIKKPTAANSATKPARLNPRAKYKNNLNTGSIVNFPTTPLSGTVFTRPNMRENMLSAVPDPELAQVTEFGPLPKVGADGRRPYQVYAKPFEYTDKRPRIGIVVTGLGLSDAATVSAIQGLPGSVTLAFAPYSSRITEWINLARTAGHEVLVNIPMEPLDYPTFNPGPHALLTTISVNGNLDRLLWNLGRSSGYVGVVDFYGSRFTGSRKHMRPILAELKKRGLLYLDSGSSPQPVAALLSHQLRLPIAESTLTLDERASRREVDKKFNELEKRAALVGNAIGIASPFPVSLERIAVWVRLLRARGYAIAPITALVESVFKEPQK